MEINKAAANEETGNCKNDYWFSGVRLMTGGVVVW
jgi:hypothetical protein